MEGTRGIRSCRARHLRRSLQGRRAARWQQTRLKDGAAPSQEVVGGFVGVVLRLDAEPVALGSGEVKLVVGEPSAQGMATLSDRRFSVGRVIFGDGPRLLVNRLVS